jgi:hypothetical protein
MKSFGLIVLFFFGDINAVKSIGNDIEKNFDSIDKINIAPHDIRRVLFNLYTNAFYTSYGRSRSAVNARLNESFGQEQKIRNFISYQPTVSVSTKNEGNRVVKSPKLKKL